MKNKQTKEERELTKKAEQVKRVRDSNVSHVKFNIDNGFVPEPTRYHKVGDQVKIGNLKNVKVTEVLFDGFAYEIYYDYMGQAYGQPVRQTGTQVWDWTHVFPINAFPDSEPMRQVDDIQIRYYNNDISSLLGKKYAGGIDFNPDYQRDLVWTMEQKIALLDSIFNNIEIGKFTFINRGNYSEGYKYYYEILDGKQRLTTICDYYEDRFSYRGKKFTELCPTDAGHFRRFPIIQGEVGNISKQQILKLFVRMNTSGTPIDKAHLERVKSMIE